MRATRNTVSPTLARQAPAFRRSTAAQPRYCSAQPCARAAKAGCRPRRNRLAARAAKAIRRSMSVSEKMAHSVSASSAALSAMPIHSIGKKRPKAARRAPNQKTQPPSASVRIAV